MILDLTFPFKLTYSLRIKDDWFLLEGEDQITCKKVVIENYNLHTSESEVEKQALAVFNDLLKENNPKLDTISYNALVYGTFFISYKQHSISAFSRMIS